MRDKSSSTSFFARKALGRVPLVAVLFDRNRSSKADLTELFINFITLASLFPGLLQVFLSPVLIASSSIYESAGKCHSILLVRLSQRNNSCAHCIRSVLAIFNTTWVWLVSSSVSTMSRPIPSKVFSGCWHFSLLSSFWSHRKNKEGCKIQIHCLCLG